MAWNWQRPDWPQFTFDAAALEPFERQFLLRSGEFIGVLKHVGEDDRDHGERNRKGRKRKSGRRQPNGHRSFVAPDYRAINAMSIPASCCPAVT